MFSYTAEVRALVPLVQLISKKGEKRVQFSPPPNPFDTLVDRWRGADHTAGGNTLISHQPHTSCLQEETCAVSVCACTWPASDVLQTGGAVRTAPNVRFSRCKNAQRMSKQAYAEFSRLICAAAMIRLHCGARAKDGRRRWGGVGGFWAGLGWQTKRTARRCGDSASAFTQAGGRGRGGDRKVRGVIESPCPSHRAHTWRHVHAHTQTLTHTPSPDRHKSLWLNASAAAARVLNAARRGFIPWRRHCHGTHTLTHTFSS